MAHGWTGQALLRRVQVHAISVLNTARSGLPGIHVSDSRYVLNLSYSRPRRQNSRFSRVRLVALLSANQLAMESNA